MSLNLSGIKLRITFTNVATTISREARMKIYLDSSRWFRCLLFHFPNNKIQQKILNSELLLCSNMWDIFHFGMKCELCKRSWKKWLKNFKRRFPFFEDVQILTICVYLCIQSIYHLLSAFSRMEFNNRLWLHKQKGNK